MFINLSNHPSNRWTAEQAEAAKKYGDIIDLLFPTVDPNGDETYISGLADTYCQKAIELAEGKAFAVHLMGEMTLTYALVARFKDKGIPCMASTTERIITELPDGRKVSCFKFVKFRKYQ